MINSLKIFLVISFLFLTSIVIAQPGSAERIIFFNSDIMINTDGSMIVTETIKVHSEANQIKRGIYRDFPTRYKDSYGNNVVIEFEILEVLRDSYPDNHHTEDLSNGIRIYIGKSDYNLKPDDYTYTIKYKTDRQLGFFENHDELYWNVTGNGWDFFIEKASATIQLPKEVFVGDIKVDAFTGYQGSTEKNFNVVSKTGNRINLETSNELLPKQGFTILVMFPKGIVKEKAFEEKFFYFIDDNLSIIIALAGLLVLLIYYVMVWLGYGVDPKKGLVIPLYEPPDNLSPGAIRFISEMGYDNKAFTSAVINIAVKGHLRIDESNGNFTLIKTNNPKTLLTNDEKKLFEKLVFEQGISKSNGMDIQQLELKQQNHAILRNSINEFKKSLKNSCEKIYFVTNRKYFLVGLAITFLTIFITAISGNSEQTFSIIWLSVWSFGVTMLLFAVYKAWRGVISSGRTKVTSVGGAIFISLFSIPFVIGEIAGFYFLSEFASPFLVPIIALSILCNIIFYHLLKAPTHLGRKLMDKIEGFKMYFSTAEQDRVEQFKSPEQTPQLFEQYLPFAIALGVENQWAEKFKSIISSASETTSYSPGWYSGIGWSTLGAAGFASNLSSSLASTISSSSTAPGSSSGGSGGGSSGGGGGGGGGGGW